MYLDKDGLSLVFINWNNCTVLTQSFVENLHIPRCNNMLLYT